jgi:hypothetical protein
MKKIDIYSLVIISTNGMLSYIAVALKEAIENELYELPLVSPKGIVQPWFPNIELMEIIIEG